MNLNLSVVERRNFGDLLSADGLSRLNVESVYDIDSLSQRTIPDQAVIAVWSGEGMKEGHLPVLLVCQDGMEPDWAAWITTFAARIRPFTAFTRLVSQSELKSLTVGMQPPTLRRFAWPVAGLVLGEVLASSRLPDKSLENMPASACESTLSFAMFRAAAAYPRFQQWPQLVQRWEVVRQATRQHPRLLETPEIAKVCATVIEAADLGAARSQLGQSNMTVVEACRELLMTPGRVPSVLFANPDFAGIEDKMWGPREQRVVAFGNLVNRLGNTKQSDGPLTAFMLGYLASRIAPGTIQHSGVLAPVARSHPMALLWYGFSAGFQEQEGRGHHYGGGKRTPLDLPASARRVARDLARPDSPFVAPTCDIAFPELIALSRTGGDPLADIISATQGTAVVELAPLVWTVVNVSARTVSESAMRAARERDLLSTMGEHIDRLRDAHTELLDGNTVEFGQKPLFPSKRKKT